MMWNDILESHLSYQNCQQQNLLGRSLDILPRTNVDFWSVKDLSIIVQPDLENDRSFHQRLSTIHEHHFLLYMSSNLRINDAVTKLSIKETQLYQCLIELQQPCWPLSPLIAILLEPRNFYSKREHHLNQHCQQSFATSPFQNRVGLGKERLI